MIEEIPFMWDVLTWLYNVHGYGHVIHEIEESSLVLNMAVHGYSHVIHKGRRVVRVLVFEHGYTWL